MAISVTRIGDSFVGEVSGVDLSEDHSPEVIAQLRQALLDHIVRTHPESGRKALFVNEGFTVRLDGSDAQEQGDLLAELYAHTKQERFIYRRQWSVGDLVFWDNRMTMHCATDYDLQYARRMHRTTVQGDTPY